MKKTKMKIITASLSIGMVAVNLLTPISAYAATSNSCTISNGLETSVATNDDMSQFTTTAGSAAYLYGANKSVGLNFNVNIDVLGIANKIISAMNANSFNSSRAAYCKGLMESAFYAAGGKYNVVVFDLSQNYKYTITGVKLFATSQFDGTTYGIWVFNKNQPKGSYFRNDGKRGWDHWACRGWQTQIDNVMWYNK